jgi:hypothetical protein
MTNPNGPQRHFDERLAAPVVLDPVCARGEISHGYAIYIFGATASHPFWSWRSCLSSK